MHLTEPQVWTIIGVFGAVMLGAFTLVISVFRFTMTSMRNELVSRMDAGFESMNRRMDHLDRDVQLLMPRDFGDNRP